MKMKHYGYFQKRILYIQLVLTWENWTETTNGQVGCMKIFGEQIFESDDSEPSLETVYDWALEDINPNSEYYFPDYGETIGPSTYMENQHVSVYYFGKAG